MAVYAFKREEGYHHKNVENEIQMINIRIDDMMQHGYNVNRFLRFVEKYYGTNYIEDNELEGIRISIFEKGNDFPVRFIGEPIFETLDNDPENIDKKYFAFNVRENEDMGVIIKTVIPHNFNQTKWEVFDSGFWIFVLIMGIAATAFCFITASHMARNVDILRDFTERASTDEGFQPSENFTNDELGEISARIIEIYNQRKSAREAHEREHQIALKASEERARLKRQISNNVNHELKTPVGIIRGYVETLLNNPEMDQTQKRHFMEKIQKQVERLVLMLDDLSTLTRLDDASGVIPTREVDMNQLLETLDEEIYESGIGGDMTFFYDLPENCIVKGSESLLNAAILNFVKNSAAYSNGSEMGLIYTGEDDNFYTFSFIDNGTGVEEEHLSKLFERFYRVESGRSRKKGGTGLGLSIVKSTIISMGGSISVRNREEGGLEFQFTLPKWKKG